MLYGAEALKEANEVLHQKESRTTLILWMDLWNPSLIQWAALLCSEHVDASYTQLAGHFIREAAQHQALSPTSQFSSDSLVFAG